MERLVKYFEPERYELELFVDKHKKTIGGKVTILGKAKAEKIKFHAVGLSVDEVLVNGKKADFAVADGLLTLFKVPRSDLRVEIGYHGSLNENMQGAYLASYEHKGKKELMVATQFESHYAREAFPCIDEPAAKAEFVLSISIPEQDKDDIVLANTPHDSKRHLSGTGSRPPVVTGAAPLLSRRNSDSPLEMSFLNHESSWWTFSFQPTPRMSTYLLAFVIGKMQGKSVTNAHGTVITTYATLAQEADAVDFANEIAAKSLEFYDDKFGVPYPLEKLDQVALPDFEAGAMENWGLVTYRESMMLVPSTATMATKKQVALTVAHELAHQWFGNLVTMEWWDDLWLNESFASIMEYFVVDAVYPKYHVFEDFFTGDCYAALVRDAYTDVQSVHQEVTEPAEIATLFDGAIVYSKGAHLMLMLIRAMGMEKFLAGCHDYFEKHKYGNTVGDDLWAALGAHADFDTKALMHSFIDKPGYPVFTDGRQERFLLDGEMPESDWPVPEVTEDMSGHYVINLSEDEFNERLARFDKLSEEEKLRLLIDRSLVTRTTLAEPGTLVPLLWQFRQENSAAVWSIMAVIVGNLKIFCTYGSEGERKLKHFVGQLVAEKLQEVGLTTRKNDDVNTLRLRSILVGLDFYAETEENLRELAKAYSRDLTALEPEMRADILDAKIRLEPEKIEEYVQAYTRESDPEIKFDLLAAGTLVKDKKALAKMVKLLGQTEIVKPQDQLYLYIYLYRNPVVREEMWRYLTKNWEAVAQMMGEKTMDSYPRLIANIMKTPEELEAYREFFGARREDPVLKRAIQIGEKEIAARIALIEVGREGVYKALDAFEAGKR